MRVLVVHNAYSGRMPSGENVSVRSEVAWLRDAGVDVHLHEVTNDDLLQGGALVRLRTGARTLWSRPARRTVADVIEETAPDVVHVHNLFPLLSPSVTRAATRRRLPVAWTVRNRRITCVKGGHFRDGAPCYACRPGWRLPGVRHGCYNDSPTASALLTGATSLFGAIARRQVTPIAISEHMREWLAGDAGFPAERIAVKYNGVTPPSPVGGDEGTTPAAAGRALVFVGKLTEHKGVHLLLDAWRRAGDIDAELRFVGNGPLASRVTEAAEHDSRITWAGQVPADELGAHLGDARAVLVPSTWQEPFGRVAAEALAFGRPVITTGAGGLAEVVDGSSGWITGQDPEALAKALTEAARSDTAVSGRAQGARTRYERLFSPEATTRDLIAIYENQVMHRPDDRGGAPAPAVTSPQEASGGETP